MKCSLVFKFKRRPTSPRPKSVHILIYHVDAGTGRHSDEDLRPLLGNVTKHKIVPDMLSKQLTEGKAVQFTSTNQSVRMGNTIRVSTLRDEPMTESHETPGNLYTILMLHPDVPTRKNPTKRSSLLMLKVNAENSNTWNVDYENIIMHFTQPRLGQDTEAHRIVFFAFCQNKRKINPDVERTWTSNGESFNLTKFRVRNKLYLPYATNFFLYTR
ncbi:hypothetical protein HPB47_022714 [Ixodes persulcatus]|uniref:Uncharacterized protein n=1 Tax=Ixodes persulcatus TaxID=34615 RepID=A0AC60QC55_IXOPE|nr:hypothetical protein HPB47_022714 [Ixodes persulcatus]